jgi:hypothetical protein
MQHRRMKKWDKYGVDEALNDVDLWGKGIQVPVSYFMFFNDKKNENPKAFHSKQRAHQRRIDQPLTVFYAKEWKMVQDFDSPTLSALNFTLAATQLELDPATMEKEFNTSAPNAEYKQGKTIKTLAYAVGKGVVMLRIANLEDRFDGRNNSESYNFDLNAWAKEYYMEANAHLMQGLSPEEQETFVKAIEVNITEMNAAGSIALDRLVGANSTVLTQWKVPAGEDPSGPSLAQRDSIYSIPAEINGTESTKALEAKKATNVTIAVLLPQ